MVDSKKYVVLDVETNGLSSKRDDLLSLSIYKPDDKKTYDRYLPLELNTWVETYWINGITEEMLEDKEPLTQSEFDVLLKDFELDKRIILTYGSIDERFIRNYLHRKKIDGFDKLTFYNFKHDIISSAFSEGNITKDNLCAVYGIENINKVHSGLNDCILEWKLFEKMNGNKLMVIGNSVNEFNSDYIIPASYLQNFPNFKYCIGEYPKVKYEMVHCKTFHIESKKIKKFETNISGLTIEHLIYTMLDVKDMDEESYLFQIENRKKLKNIGYLPSAIHHIHAVFNNDGTISAVNKEDEKKVEEINKTTQAIKEEISPLVEYIKKRIFKNKRIMSQELVVNTKDNVMAKCDLSSEDAILEIKTYFGNIDKFKYQLYYESNGRNIYILRMIWQLKKKKGIDFKIYKVKEIDIAENSNSIKYEKKIKERLNKSKETIRKNRLSSYQYKIAIKSNYSIQIIKYVGAKEDAIARCLICGHEWTRRADHLLERCYCPMCRNGD